MKMRSIRYMTLVFVALPPVLQASDAIRVEVSIADAVVAPRTDEAQALVPTDLEYMIEIEAKCEADNTPWSLSIGVADMRHHFPLSDTNDASRFGATFVVPSRQLAPVATTGYCIADDPDSHTTMLIEEAFTAQLSLSCRSESSHSMHYVSQPLSVRLVCELPDENQEPSPEAAAR